MDSTLYGLQSTLDELSRTQGIRFRVVCGRHVDRLLGYFALFVPESQLYVHSTMWNKVSHGWTLGEAVENARLRVTCPEQEHRYPSAMSFSRKAGAARQALLYLRKCPGQTHYGEGWDAVVAALEALIPESSRP